MNPEYLYAPLFPLPNVILYPRALLPLHIFEPRYRKMVAGALAGDRLMAVALLKPGWEEAYYEAPPVYRVVGMGKIIDDERLDNGNYNVWLSGLERAQIIHEVQEKPFRVAKIQILADRPNTADPEKTSVARRELVAATRDLRRVCPSLKDALGKAVDEHIYPGALADALASLLCADIYEKQCVLAEADLVRRLSLVTVQARARFNEALIDARVREREV